MPTATWARIVIFLAAALWLLVSILMGVPVQREWFRPLGAAASLAVLALLAFDVFLWRLLPTWLVKVPNIRGTWHARLTSSFAGATGEPVELSCFLVIRQSYSRIHIEMLFPKSESVSTSAQILTSDGTAELWYSYRSEAHSLDRTNNPPHKGAVQLRISRNGKSTLAGSYWTDRETHGRIETVAHHKKVISDYGSAAGAFTATF